MSLPGRVNSLSQVVPLIVLSLSLVPGSEDQTGFTSISLPPMCFFCWSLFIGSPANSHQGVNRVGERLEAAEYLGQAERDSYRSSGVLPGQIGPGKIR